MSQDSKSSLRKMFLAQRDSVSAESLKAASAKMVEALTAFVEREKPSVVLGFAAFRGEPDLTEFYLNSKISIYLPVVKDRVKKVMEFYAHPKTSEHWRIGPFGLSEPDPEKCAVLSQMPERALVLVPALSVDREGYRLGYGAGFYDRFLANRRTLLTMAVVMHDFIGACLPREAHDVPVNYLLSERGVSQV